MLVTADVELPAHLRDQLRQRAAFTTSFVVFVRDHVAGFQQPVAAAAAIILPILIAFTHAVSGIFSAFEVTLTFGFTTGLFLLGAWFAKRHDIAWAYSEGIESRRRAFADLKVGRGDLCELAIRTAPLFVEHEQGVVVLVDAGHGKTLYFDVLATPSDSRWFLYVNGDLFRSQWSWLHLRGSGAVEQFSATGSLVGLKQTTLRSDAADTWEAISMALGEPADGDLIDLPMDEASQTVKRLL